MYLVSDISKHCASIEQIPSSSFDFTGKSESYEFKHIFDVTCIISVKLK